MVPYPKCSNLLLKDTRLAAAMSNTRAIAVSGTTFDPGIANE